eukprot:7923032-Pyramimonas_sp.AAC.1
MRERGYGTTLNGDMALDRNLSTTILRDVLVRGSARGQSHLRCQFKSRNIIQRNVAYARSHYKALATAKTCEDFIMQKGDNISMLVLTYPASPDRKDIRQMRRFKNHHR